MSSTIGRQELEHLAKLARIRLDPKEEEGLLKDLANILEHFKELQILDTSAVPPMTGGTELRNVFREDGEENGGSENTNRSEGVEAFPQKKNGFLKIPPVFE